jgi:hypothetical protein
MANDPCIEVEELRAAKRDLATGRAVREVRFGEDQVSYTRADLPALNQLITDAERRCAEAQGKPQRRAARSVRFRPY